MSLIPIQHSSATSSFDDERKQDLIQSLPKEVMRQIFSYLQPQELGRCFRVNRRWQVLASDDHLWKAMYPTIAFGRKQWETYFGNVGEEPPLPSNIHQILHSRCPFWPGKKVQETHLLVLIPQTVNGNPLTLKSLRELVKTPKQGNSTQYRIFHLGGYTDPPTPASHWVLMTRNVLPDSRKKSYTKQQALIARYASYQVPNILDAAVSLFMEYVRSGTRLYNDNPWTWTRCQEKHDAYWQLAVGGFIAGGLRVTYDYDDDRVGVGCLRKF